MRLTILIWFMLSFGVFATSYSQDARINLDVTTATTVKSVLKMIEDQSRFRFFYNSDLAELNKPVTVSLNEKNITEVLNSILAGTSVGYRVLENNFVVLSPEAMLQQISITGTITENGEPMPGVNVLVKGTLTGVVTDANGKYSITVPDRNAVLVYSFIGYTTVEKTVGDQTAIDVALAEDTRQIEEVVVVAYGTQKVRNVTGAMTKLSTDELSDMPAADMAQKLQGKLSGVQIYQNTGEPNGGLNIRIRGQASITGGNSPLIVIDGFPSRTGLDALSPDEIEGISVLKDAASAALYGSRAANGVILVTTRAARAGKTNIEFSANYGMAMVGDHGKPDVMNAQEFAQFKKEYYQDQMVYEGREDPIPDIYVNPDQVKDGTDWYDVLLRTAKTQNYNLSLTTGIGRMRSSVNLNYMKHEGVILNTFAERISARANNVFEASDRVTFGLNLSGSFRYSQITPGLGEGRNIIGSAFLMDPQRRYMNDDGTYPVGWPEENGVFANANYYRVLTERKNPNNRTNALATAYVDVKIIDGLKYRLSANGNLSNRVTQQWIPSTAQGGMFSMPPRPASGNYATQNSINWLVENTLTYTKTLAGKHNFDLLAGYTTQKDRDQGATIESSSFPDDEVEWYGAAATRTGNGGSVGEYSIVSYLGRLSYDYAGKYLLQVAFRSDGCSRFGTNMKFANFPSVSLGWIVSDESFLQDIDWLNYLKLRGSWGKVGNNNIGDYTYLATITNTNYVFNGSETAGRKVDRLQNNDLTWETTVSYDLGLDFGFFNDRIFVVYDYYWKKTDGLLYNIELPRQSGFANVQSNYGEFNFWGHEINIETKNFVKSKFQWKTSLNMSFPRNKAVSLGPENVHIGGNANQEDYNRTTVGRPLGQFMGYIYDGVFMTQTEYEAGPKHTSSMIGTVRMKDVSGPDGVPDGIIDMDDRTFIGDPNPKMLYGITNEFAYGNFDASIVMAGSVGNKIIDGTREWTENLDGVFNVRKEVAERWRSPENPGNGKIPRTRSNTTELFRYNNTRWVFDGTYLMVKSLTFGYTVPLKSNPFLKGVRFYASAQNLLTLTKYPGMNPEVNDQGSNGLYQGRDRSAFPVPKLLTLGVNVKF